MKVYADDNSVTIVGEDVAVTHRPKDLKLSVDQKRVLNTYGQISLYVIFVAPKSAWVDEEDLLKDLTPFTYTLGETYTGEQLKKHSLPDGSIILDEEYDPYRKVGGFWLFGNTTMEIMNWEKFKIIYLPEVE